MNKTTEPARRHISRFIFGIFCIVACIATGYHGIQLTEQHHKSQQNHILHQQQRQLNILIRQQAEQAMQGSNTAFADLRQAREAYGQHIEQYTPSQSSQWLALHTEIEQILLAQAALQAQSASQSQFQSLLDPLLADVIQLAERLAAAQSPDTALAIPAISWVQQMRSADQAALAEQQAALSTLYTRLSDKLNQPPTVADPNIRTILDHIRTALITLGEQVTNLSADQPIKLRAEQAYQALNQTLDTSFSDTTHYQPTTAYLIQLPGYTPQQTLYGLIGITLILLLGWMLSNHRHNRRQVQYAQQLHQLNTGYQTGLHKLAAGDLTDIQPEPAVLGEVAQQMQRMIRKIQQVHLQITNCGHETQASSLRLQETAEHQQDQTEHAISQNQQLTDQLEQQRTAVTAAETESQAILHSLAQIVTSQPGADIARLQQSQQVSIEQVQQAQTTTQHIQDQMRLIEELADQSNILALNAAMQAALAGEAGRAFTVVSNEVQRLAQQANQSARQIGGLLDTIQDNHHISLEQLQETAQHLDQSATVTAERELKLVQLNQSSQQHTQQITQLSQATQQHIKEAGLLNDNLHIVHNIGQQTHESTVQIAEAVSALSAQADPLHTMIEQYQTPSATPTLSAN